MEMTPPSKDDQIKQMAENILRIFNHEPRRSPYCIEVQEKVEAALRQVHDEAIEKAADLMDRCVCDDDDPLNEKTRSQIIRALKLAPSGGRKEE